MSRAIDVIRNALAMGADRGIHVTTDLSTDQQLQPLAVAKVFRHVMEEHKFDMALMGKPGAGKQSWRGSRSKSRSRANS